MSSIYEVYPDYLSSKRWQTIRRWRLWLDGGGCRTCPNRQGLHTHHVRYRWLAQAWWFGPIPDVRPRWFGPVQDVCPWWMLPEVFWLLQRIGMLIFSLLRRIGMLMETANAITLCSECHGGVHGAQPIEVFREGLRIG